MTNETLDERDREELEAKGWEVETTNQALVWKERRPSYSETLNYLIEVGDEAAKHRAMPTIRIDDGTEVTLRIGREPAPTLTADEIRLAKALAGIGAAEATTD